MRKSLLIILLCAIGSGIALAVEPAPEPSTPPSSWELNFKFEDPQRVSVILPDKKDPVVYWYMLYSIENPSDREVDFYPQFDLVTDTLKVVRSEIKVSPEAFKAIFQRTGNPLLLPPEKMTGRLLRGKDRVRHGVAIWRDFDPKAKSFTAFVAGLSGETARWHNPAFDETTKQSETNKRFFILRKTLSIPYKLPGSVQVRAQAIPERVTKDQKWIMR